MVVRLPAFTASARRRLDSLTQFYRRHLILISITTTSCLTGDLVLGGWDCLHYRDVIMGAIASQITSLTIVYSTVYSDADQRKHQSSASLAFVRGIHRGPVNSPHKWPVTRKKFPFDDVIMRCCLCMCISLTLMLCRCLERCLDQSDLAAQWWCETSTCLFGNSAGCCWWCVRHVFAKTTNVQNFSTQIVIVFW